MPQIDIIFYFLCTLHHNQVLPLVRPGDTNAAPSETLNGESIARALPLDRKAVDDFEYGYKEPLKITRGRITLRQAIKFIGEHQNGPEKWTAAYIANEYKLKESVVGEFCVCIVIAFLIGLLD